MNACRSFSLFFLTMHFKQRCRSRYSPFQTFTQRGWQPLDGYVPDLRYRTRIYISALRKCRFVPLDDAQRIAVDHLLRSWGFTNWDAVKSMNASVMSSCGYTFYVSKEEFDKRYDPLLPRTLPPHLLRHILSFNHKSVRTHCL